MNGLKDFSDISSHSFSQGAPIGVFDSGVGGLTVLKTLAQNFPNESFLYLGDTARVPYGSKSAQTIFNYSKQIIQYLAKREVKAIVIACNSASSHFTESRWENLPIYNVIEPGASMALSVSAHKRIGVLGTRATIKSQSYPKAIKKINPSAEIFQVACPLLVPLAEEGWIMDPITNLITYRYVQQLAPHQVDTIVLGCTHYPILKESIQKAAGSQITLVESGEALVEILKHGLKTETWSPRENSLNHEREIEILATDRTDSFEELARQILAPLKIQKFGEVSLEN